LKPWNSDAQCLEPHGVHELGQKSRLGKWAPDQPRRHTAGGQTRQIRMVSLSHNSQARLIKRSLLIKTKTVRIKTTTTTKRDHHWTLIAGCQPTHLPLMYCSGQRLSPVTVQNCPGHSSSAPFKLKRTSKSPQPKQPNRFPSEETGWTRHSRTPGWRASATGERSSSDKLTPS
jgi:hypothetical protein